MQPIIYNPDWSPKTITDNGPYVGPDKEHVRLAVDVRS
jgi:hypothetical protein